jgi:hypothetical protein
LEVRSRGGWDGLRGRMEGEGERGGEARSSI